MQCLNSTLTVKRNLNLTLSYCGLSLCVSNAEHYLHSTEVLEDNTPVPRFVLSLLHFSTQNQYFATKGILMIGWQISNDLDID